MAQTLPIDAPRLHLAERSPHSVGWLFAPADKQMRAVISAMHAEPARRWTLADLAGVGGMLRSSFAVGFKETVGEAAIDYLTRRRMLGLPIGWRAGGLGALLLGATRRIGRFWEREIW